MIFGLFVLLVAIIISSVSAFYSVLGLLAIFAAPAAFWPIVIMGSTLEIGKVATVLWLHKNWKRAELQYKLYLVPAVLMLLVLTSISVFGFLSKAHLEQAVPSGDIQAQVALFDEKIKTQRDNIEAARKALTQMDAAVDQTIARSTSEDGASRAAALRRNQQKERGILQNDISKAQKEITTLQEERAPIASSARKIEADVGPIKYVAALLFSENPESTLLEKAVRWVIMLIVCVFDPLAIVLLLAGTKQLEWGMEDRKQKKANKVIEPPVTRQVDKPQLPDIDDKIEEANEAFHAATEEIITPTIVAPETSDEANDNLIELKMQHAELIDELARQQAAILEFKNAVVELDEERVKTAEKERIAIVEIEQLRQEKQAITDELTKVQERNKSLEIRNGVNQSMIKIPEPVPPVEPILPSIIAHVEPPPPPVILDSVTQTETVEEILQASPDIFESITTAEPVVITSDYPTEAEMSEIESLPAPSLIKITESIIEPALPFPPPKFGFGAEFPPSPSKGDVFLRTEFKPSRMFKWNDIKWIEVSKDAIYDSYASDNIYIGFLAEKLSSGEYDVDDLSELEQANVQLFLEGKL